MSNLIKSGSIQFTENKKVIEVNQTFFHLNDVLPLPNIKVNEGEVESNEISDVNKMKELIDEEKAFVESQVEELLENAKIEAARLIESAKEEALQIKNLAHEEGKKQGYLEGFKAGSDEIQKLEEEFEEKERIKQEEYQQLVAELEPKFVDVLIQLIEKITGVFAEERRDIILHLLKTALVKTEKSEHFTIRVSKEDYRYLSFNQEILYKELSEKIQLELVEDSTMTKNQCIIEADNEIIDCSLDVQISNLIADLKLLACI